jgi:hypothetical protein
MKCEAEQRTQERAHEAVANARHLDEEFNTGKIGVASKTPKAFASRLFDIGHGKSETLKETGGAILF